MRELGLRNARLELLGRDAVTCQALHASNLGSQIQGFMIGLDLSTNMIKEAAIRPYVTTIQLQIALSTGYHLHSTIMLLPKKDTTHTITHYCYTPNTILEVHQSPK